MLDWRLRFLFVNAFKISPSPYDSIFLNSSWHKTLQNQSKLISDFKLNSKARFPCSAPDPCFRLNWGKSTNKYFYCTKHSTFKKKLMQNIQITCNVFLNINSLNLDNNVTHLPLHYPLQKRRYRLILKNIRCSYFQYPIHNIPVS